MDAPEPEVAKREKDRPSRLRPDATQEEVAEEPARGLTAIDNPDDADLYPPTETPGEGRRRRRGLPRRERA